MHGCKLLLSALSLTILGSGCASSTDAPFGPWTLQYLEIVTPAAEETCTALESLYGPAFGEPQADLGFARAVTLDDGRMITVRAPLHGGESSVVRPYFLVDDIEAALGEVEALGAEIAMSATEIPGRGRFAIYFLGGIEHGLWER